MSKKYFKPVRKDVEWGPELSRDPPKLGYNVDAIADAVACITIKARKQPPSLSTYNAKISEFTKQLAASKPDMLPKDRVVRAREMYKEWKALQ